VPAYTGRSKGSRGHRNDHLPPGHFRKTGDSRSSALRHRPTTFEAPPRHRTTTFRDGYSWVMRCRDCGLDVTDLPTQFSAERVVEAHRAHITSWVGRLAFCTCGWMLNTADRGDAQIAAEKHERSKLLDLY